MAVPLRVLLAVLLKVFRMFLRDNRQNVINILQVYAHRRGRLFCRAGFDRFDNSGMLAEYAFVLAAHMQTQTANPVHVSLFRFNKCSHALIVGKAGQCLVKFIVQYLKGNCIVICRGGFLIGDNLSYLVENNYVFYF